MLRKIKIYWEILQNAHRFAEQWRGSKVSALKLIIKKALMKAKEWRDFINMGTIQKGFMKLEFEMNFEKDG